MSNHVAIAVATLAGLLIGWLCHKATQIQRGAPKRGVYFYTGLAAITASICLSAVQDQNSRELITNGIASAGVSVLRPDPSFSFTGRAFFRHGGHAMVAYASGNVGLLPMDETTRDRRAPDAEVGRFAPVGDTKYLR